MQKPNNYQIVVIAHKIRSLYNVGSIFRTCDAIGAQKLYLSSYTASPKEQPVRLSKTALGADKTVPWEKTKTISPIIKKYKKLGYEIIALEETKNQSIFYNKWQPTTKILIILGNEVNGISKSTLKMCDKIIQLPMLGQKKSLNVTVAFGAIAYYILSKFR